MVPTVPGNQRTNQDVAQCTVLHRSYQAPLLLCCLEELADTLEGVITTVGLCHKPAGSSTTHNTIDAGLAAAK